MLQQAPITKPVPSSLRDWLTNCHPSLGDTADTLIALGISDTDCLLSLTRGDWLAVLEAEPLPHLSAFQRALLKSRVPKFLPV